MSKMADKELELKEKTQEIIVALVFVIILAILMYSQEININKKEQEKANYINSLEQRINKQEGYMHQVQADIDNLYRVVE